MSRPRKGYNDELTEHRHRISNESTNSEATQRAIIPECTFISSRRATDVTLPTRTSHENKRKRIIKSVNNVKPKSEEKNIEVYSRSEPIAGPSREYPRADSNRAERSTIVRSSRNPNSRIEASNKALPTPSFLRHVKRPTDHEAFYDQEILRHEKERSSQPSGLNLSWKAKFEGMSDIINPHNSKAFSNNYVQRNRRIDSEIYTDVQPESRNRAANELSILKETTQKNTSNRTEQKNRMKIEVLEAKCMSYKMQIQVKEDIISRHKEKENQYKENELKYKENEIQYKQNEIQYKENLNEMQKMLEKAQADKMEFKEKWMDLKRIKQSLKEKVDKQAEEISLLNTMKTSLKDEIKKQDEQISLLRRKPLDIDYLVNRISTELSANDKSSSNHLGILQLTEQKNSLAVQLREAFQNNEDTIQDLMKRFKDLVESQLHCSICSDLLVFCTTITCGHTFCTECIEEWRKYKNNCPICRAYIRHQAKTPLVDNFIDKFIEGFVPETYKQTRKQLLEERKRKEIERDTAARMEFIPLEGITGSISDYSNDQYPQYAMNDASSIPDDDDLIEMSPGLDVTLMSTPSSVRPPATPGSSIQFSPFSTGSVSNNSRFISPYTQRSLAQLRRLNPPAMRSPRLENRRPPILINIAQSPQNYVHENTISLDISPRLSPREVPDTPPRIVPSRFGSRSRSRSTIRSFSSSFVSQYLGRSRSPSFSSINSSRSASGSSNNLDIHSRDDADRSGLNGALDNLSDLTYSPEDIFNVSTDMSGNGHNDIADDDTDCPSDDIFGTYRDPSITEGFSENSYSGDNE